MFWNKYFLPSFITTIFVVGLHWIGSIYGLYDNTNWYDVLMHFLGGVWVVVFFLWILHTKYINKYKNASTIKNLIIVVIIVGILWEIHEVLFGFTVISDDGYAFDTVKDLCMDTIGGFVCALFTKNNT